MRGRTGIEVVGSASPREAVRGADAVLCATNSFSPVFCAEWIEPGVHIGTVQHFELDLAVFDRADVLAVHYMGGPTPVVASSRGIGQADSMEGMRKKVREALRERRMPNLHDLVLGRAKGESLPDRPHRQSRILEVPQSLGVVPVTLLKAGPCMVVQRKTPTTDGYDAVQLGLL